MSETPTAEKLTSVYLKIKDKRSELTAKFKEEDSALSEQLNKVKRALLDYCEEQGVDSVKTSAGMFYRSARTRYWTSDWSSMHEFILENEVPELLDKRVNQNNIKQYLEENPDKVPKGLNVDSEYIVSVRRK
jgi:aspartate/tyrosine/aromatic aminotransferase